MVMGAWVPGRANNETSDFEARIREIERSSGGRLGVALLDTRSGSLSGYRMNERFPMCSTFKFLAVAALLKQVDEGREQLSRRVHFTSEILLPHSPMTKDYAGGEGMPLGKVCEAAITQSDNTAANLLLGRIGGPEGLTHFARSIGDNDTRLDRTEPTLNEGRPGDPRDTTTPAAMAGSLNALILGRALSPESRGQLTAWIKNCQTGAARLRAGLPQDWTIGDRTGTGDRTANDIAVVWPPNRSPVIVTAYLTESTATPDQRDATLATIGRAVRAAL
jgi:beta-lactamase class A